MNGVHIEDTQAIVIQTVSRLIVYKISISKNVLTPRCVFSSNSEVVQQYSPSSNLSAQIICLAWSPAVGQTNKNKQQLVAGIFKLMRFDIEVLLKYPAHVSRPSTAKRGIYAAIF